MLINIQPKETIGKIATQINVLVSSWDKQKIQGGTYKDVIMASYNIMEADGNSIANDTMNVDLTVWDNTLDWIINYCIDTLGYVAA